MHVKTPTVDPIECLQEQIITLKEAFAACQANPTSSAVHHLRTNIRRVEAQMKLLNQLQDLPPHHHETRKLYQELKKVRRYAGKVRDLDIQRELIMVHSTSITATDARRLHRWLKRQRDNEAAELHKMLQRTRAKVFLTLDRLYEALHSDERFSLSATQLVALTQAWFARHCRPNDTIEHLHATRKAAKLARYMVETARGSTTATKIAKSLEDIQRAGGQWHDWIQLVGIAIDKLGKRHPLAESFKGQCDLSLRGYRTKIVEGPPGISGAVRRMPRGSWKRSLPSQ
jgi:CHAD domain-containing protein